MGYMCVAHTAHMRPSQKRQKFVSIFPANRCDFCQNRSSSSFWRFHAKCSARTAHRYRAALSSVILEAGQLVHRDTTVCWTCWWARRPDRRPSGMYVRKLHTYMHIHIYMHSYMHAYIRKLHTYIITQAYITIYIDLYRYIGVKCYRQIMTLGVYKCCRHCTEFPNTSDTVWELDSFVHFVGHWLWNCVRQGFV